MGDPWRWGQEAVPGGICGRSTPAWKQNCGEDGKCCGASLSDAGLYGGGDRDPEPLCLSPPCKVMLHQVPWITRHSPQFSEDPFNLWLKTPPIHSSSSSSWESLGDIGRGQSASGLQGRRERQVAVLSQPALTSPQMGQEMLGTKWVGSQGNSVVPSDRRPCSGWIGRGLSTLSAPHPTASEK